MGLHCFSVFKVSVLLFFWTFTVYALLFVAHIIWSLQNNLNRLDDMSSKDIDQTAQMCSLINVFAEHLCSLASVFAVKLLWEA